MSDAGPVTVVRAGPGDVVPKLADSAAELFRNPMSGGAALGWVDPPTDAEISSLLGRIADNAPRGDAALIIARRAAELAGLGYW